MTSAHHRRGLELWGPICVAAGITLLVAAIGALLAAVTHGAVRATVVTATVVVTAANAVGAVIAWWLDRRSR